MKLAFPMPHLMRLPAASQPWEAAIDGLDQTRMAKRADELGYDMIAVPEHFVIPRDHVERSGPHWFHGTTAQAYLAGATERIRVNSCVTILPLQNPIVLAKAIATADWLSGGRFMATFGVGWMEREFELLAVPFKERGRIADEYLAALVELWTSETPSYQGRYLSFDDIAFEPKPVQKPHPPIWIGGDVDASLRRAARFGSGWWPFLTNPDDIPAKLDFIKSQSTYDGRHFDVFHGLGTGRIGATHEAIGKRGAGTRGAGTRSAQELVDALGRLGELGVTFSAVTIPPVSGVEAYLDYAQWVIEEIKPKLP